MAYQCPFCGWDSLKIVNPAAVDVCGNQYRHGICANCSSEAIYLKRGPKVNKEGSPTEQHGDTNRSPNPTN